MTAFHNACFWGNIETVKLLIASGQNLNPKQKTNDKSYFSDYRNKTTLEIAKNNKCNECAKLVETYINNPKQMINELRKEIDWVTHEAELLALIIFLSDNLLEMNDEIEFDNFNVQRFLNITN